MATKPATTKQIAKNPGAQKKAKVDPKTAVLVIHGIGEQRPMETLASFVDAVWSDDRKIIPESKNDTWYKPDRFSKSLELWRVTTRSFFARKTPQPGERKKTDRRRVDFFEFYWAHRMHGHLLSDVLAWLKALYFRKPSSIPPGLLWLWWLGVGIALLIAFAAFIWAFPSVFGLGDVVSRFAPFVGTALPILFAVLVHKVLPHVGDAARYLDAAPRNISIRRQIREDGLAILERLQSSGHYDRVIVMGHSLGSAIAYDIVSAAWASAHHGARAVHKKGTQVLAALEALEEQGLTLNQAEGDDLGPARAAYRNAQRAYLTALQEDSTCQWCVTDLVTIGSPLSKAQVLLGPSQNEFNNRKKRRELPSAPPTYEIETKGGAGNQVTRERFSYPLFAADRTPHHASPFGPVVWTNVYFPNRWVFQGDIVSGPLQEVFGKAIADVRIPIGKPAWWGWAFRHTQYWKPIAEDIKAASLAAVRCSLNLKHEREESDIWASQAEAVPICAKQLAEDVML